MVVLGVDTCHAVVINTYLRMYDSLSLQGVVEKECVVCICDSLCWFPALQ